MRKRGKALKFEDFSFFHSGSEQCALVGIAVFASTAQIFYVESSPPSPVAVMYAE